ncbi:MAG: hypothetical protein NVS3B17_07790 [Vulcanimicrobiaceae bacterium]
MQVGAHDRDDFERAWPQIVARVDEAGERGAKLIVLPEGTVPAYVLGDEPVAQALLDNAAADIARVARRFHVVVVYGGAKIVSDRTYNAAIAIGPGGDELGFAAKQFLWHFDRRWYAAGDTLAPIATPVGRLGLLVCADGRIPTIAATLCDRGAELLVMPTAWVTSGRSPRAFENVQADFMAAVRARENGVPFVAANKVGVERGSVAYCGKSAIFASDGATIARGDESREEVVVGTVSLDARPHATRKTFDAPLVAETTTPSRVRIAFTPRTTAADLARLARYAGEADADVLLAPAIDPAPAAPGDDVASEVGARVVRVEDRDAVLHLGSLRLASVRAQTLRSPRALARARLAGVDAFVWFADGDSEWDVAFARTRAAELRAYVVVFVDARRAYVVDPDGLVAAGTFGDYALASFGYEPTRTAATQVAPSTDVLEGLRLAETIAATPQKEPTLA